MSAAAKSRLPLGSSPFHAAALLGLLSSPECLAQQKMGYNMECQLDSECRLAKPDILDVCCAQLVYEANGVEVKARECLSQSTVTSGFTFKGIETSEAYCDSAVL